LIIYFRLWNEIITGRFYFNIKNVVEEYVKMIKKEDVLKFFDTHMFKHKLRKLSVQEFSQKVDELPTDTPIVRGYQSVLLKSMDDLRKRNKFLKFN
jgi:F0F1-type ATP synthase beta subunit